MESQSQACSQDWGRLLQTQPANDMEVQGQLETQQYCLSDSDLDTWSRSRDNWRRGSSEDHLDTQVYTPAAPVHGSEDMLQTQQYVLAVNKKLKTKARWKNKRCSEGSCSEGNCSEGDCSAEGCRSEEGPSQLEEDHRGHCSGVAQLRAAAIP